MCGRKETKNRRLDLVLYIKLSGDCHIIYIGLKIIHNSPFKIHKFLFCDEALPVSCTFCRFIVTLLHISAEEPVTARNVVMKFQYCQQK